MFERFRKIPRFNKEVIITEKIDGTNAQIFIVHKEVAIFEMCNAMQMFQSLVDERCMGRQDDLMMFAGSRNGYLTMEQDNFGFAGWVHENHEDLFRLGEGRHYGEWWGQGIQRNYGLEERRLSMFNPKWVDQGPSCVSVVPCLAQGTDMGVLANYGMSKLKEDGSSAALGFMEPEGIVIYHTGGNHYYKQTFDFDEGKWNELQEG